MSLERWAGRAAVVTGASAGIGAAACVRLARAGLRVVGLARRPDRVEKLKEEVRGAAGDITAVRCDVSCAEEVARAFRWVEEEAGGVHVLVNNAGVFRDGHFSDLGNKQLSEEDLLSVVDINLKGSLLCARRALDSMTRRGVAGHIININSIAGHYVPWAAGFNVYPASKHALTALSAGLLNELAAYSSPIKVTSLSPGLVRTDLAGELGDTPALQPEDVADAIVYVLSTPPAVNIQELTIAAVADRRL